MTVLSEKRRRQLSFAGRIGGLKRWSSHPYARDGVTENAVIAFKQSFRVAHGGDPADYADVLKRERPIGLCRACPTRIEVPQHWDEERIEAFANEIRKAHYQRCRDLAVANRRATG